MSSLCTGLALATMGYHFHRGYLEFIPSLLWFGSMGAQCFCLVLAMVGKYRALLVSYGALLCFACSMWFVSVVPLFALCGDSLLWFLEGFKSFSTRKSICLCHLAQASFLLYFVVICMFDVGYGDGSALQTQIPA